MRIRISMILFITLSFSCVRNDKELTQGYWVESYQYIENDSFPSQRSILNLKEDKLEIREFFFDYELEGFPRITKCEYKTGDAFFLKKNFDQTVDSFKISSVGKNTIQTEYDDWRTNYTKMEHYSLADQEGKLNSILNNSIFYFSIEKAEIEFFDKDKFLLKDLTKNMSTYHYWKIEEYDKELFFVTDGGLGFMLQIKEITENEIKLIYYGKEIINISFTKVDQSQKYIKDELLGLWEQDTASMPPLNPVLIEFKEKLNPETLEISDSSITKQIRYKIDVLEYRLSLQKDKIVFINKWNDHRIKQWNIRYLRNDTLSIERLRRGDRHRSPEPEIIHYLRKR